MKTALRILAFAVALLFGAPAWAYNVAVMPVKGINLASGQPEAIGMILAQAYAKVSGYQVAGPDVTSVGLRNGMSVSAATTSLGAGEYLEAVAVALDSKIVLSVERHDYAGRTIHTANMTAVTMDDIPDIAQRLSLALLLRTTPAETRTPDTVTRAESEATNQTYSVIPKGVKSSIIFPFAKGVDIEPMASFAFELRMEKRSYFFGFAGGFMIPADTSPEKLGYGGIFAEFSGSAFLNPASNVGTYVGLGASPRLQFATDSSAVGFVPFAHFGVTFPRDSRARSLLELRIAQNVLPIGERRTDYAFDGGSAASPSLGGKYPTELSLQMGLVW